MINHKIYILWLLKVQRSVYLCGASLRQVAPLEFPQGGNAARVEG